MNQPYSENFLLLIVLILLLSLSGLAICLLEGLRRLITGPVRRALHNRWARGAARRVAERTDFDTALAKLTKENGR